MCNNTYKEYSSNDLMICQEYIIIYIYAIARHS